MEISWGSSWDLMGFHGVDGCQWDMSPLSTSILPTVSRVKKKTRLVQEPKVRLDDQPAQVYLLLPLILIVQANHRIMNPLQPPH